MKETILEIKNLTKYYGKILGVEDLSLELHKGEIFGFIGPNGAGKSTTIRSTIGLINKTNGEVLINGKPFDKNDVKIKEKIGYLPSEINLYDDLTVKEMLDYHETYYKKDTHSKRVELVKKLKLDETKQIEDLSLGNLKKLGIVLALMHDPEILILDEATSGLDPVIQDVFFKILLEEKKKGKTILYSTHILSEVKKICDRVGIIKDGHLIKVQDINSLIDNNFSIVILTSKDVDKVVKELKVEVLEKDGNTVRFKSEIESDKLIKTLAKYNIEKVYIEEATLEDIFFHYYK